MDGAGQVQDGGDGELPGFDLLIPAPGADVVELLLLLHPNELVALQVAANDKSLIVGQFVRRVVTNFLIRERSLIGGRSSLSWEAEPC